MSQPMRCHRVATALCRVLTALTHPPICLTGALASSSAAWPSSAPACSTTSAATPLAAWPSAGEGRTQAVKPLHSRCNSSCQLDHGALQAACRARSAGDHLPAEHAPLPTGFPPSLALPPSSLLKLRGLLDVRRHLRDADVRKGLCPHSSAGQAADVSSSRGWMEGEGEGGATLARPIPARTQPAQCCAAAKHCCQPLPGIRVGDCLIRELCLVCAHAARHHTTWLVSVCPSSCFLSHAGCPCGASW